MNQIIKKTFDNKKTTSIVNDCVFNLPSNFKAGEIIEINQAYKDKKIEKYSWKLINPKKNSHAKLVGSRNHTGFYLSSKSKDLSANLQTCYFIDKNYDQYLHNVIVAQPESKLNILTGCVAHKTAKYNSHQSVTEMFVEKNATLIYTMIHSWTDQSVVLPKTLIKVEEGGTFISNYILIGKVKEIKSNPTIYLMGDNSKAISNSFAYSFPNEKINLGAKIYFNAADSQGTVNSSFVCNGGKIINKSSLIGKAKNIKAHLSCDGLITQKSDFRTVPTLIAKKPNLEMTHEASIGKIANEQIEYLQTKGFTQKKAQDLIINGFIDNSLKTIPKDVQSQVKKIISQSEKGF